MSRLPPVGLLSDVRALSASITSLGHMTEPKEHDRGRSDSWKKKIGVEFSGLERPRDFAVAFAFLAGFVLLAAAIAWIVFG